MNNFEIKDGSVFVSVNPKIYPLDVIFSAAYIFTDKNYIILDGNPEEEIIVEIKPKEDIYGMEKIAMEFNNELINYSSYAIQLMRNAHLREHIIHKVFQIAGSQSTQNTHPELTSLKDSKPWGKRK